MLELKKITKLYSSGVEALKGIDIKFRKSEFVSILGQSGCGKTTLLNIIGGLDRYTSGDLVINGKSTKEFKDKDWDAYRNYSIGFVFQSYNLIPHQSVLSNVELALTLSGVSKNERRNRAIKALEDVGLKEQINKRPNELSGGQMQRVAIARALVNNPDIILADEPTGALDTKTSVQIMEILKKISKDKLIIMVTHNPELAEKYSSRIIKVLDGTVTDDSNPYDGKEEEKLTAKDGKTSMNFLTALALSLNNLMTKKGRTLLTSFAGSIGIIGIALILSLSNGVQNYITKVQEDTLSSYPLVIQESTIDIASMMESMMGINDDEDTEYDKQKIYSKNIMTDMMSTVSAKVQNNNLEELKQYLDNEDTKIKENSSAIQYKYDIQLNVYKENTEDGIVQVNPSTVMEKLGMGSSSSGQMGMMSSFSSTDVWMEMLDNQNLLETQYDLLAGNWPKAYNEVALIIGENNKISDYTLYSLGLLNQDEIEEKMKKIMDGETVEENEISEYDIEEILKMKFKLLLNTDYYEKENGIWVDKSTNIDYMKGKIANAEDLKIVSIIRRNEESVTQEDIPGIIAYRSDLITHLANKVNETDIVKEQKENKEKNVFTGMEFQESSSSTSFDYSKLSPEQQKYLSSLSKEELATLMQNYATNAGVSYEDNLVKLGSVDLNIPMAINIYPKDFESKDIIEDAIEEYNQKQKDNGKEENAITYTDIVGIMMNSVSTIINVISYVLIAFVSISLIVSSIMIGIITYISVLERTKEIGILRAIGASKKDISRVFNAETFIVGLVAGLLGIGITLLLCIPANIIIKAVAGISGVASLPITGGIILVAISMILTVIAGLIPAKLAAKKDPVDALRTE